MPHARARDNWPRIGSGHVNIVYKHARRLSGRIQFTVACPLYPDPGYLSGASSFPLLCVPSRGTRQAEGECPVSVLKVQRLPLREQRPGLSSLKAQ